MEEVQQSNLYRMSIELRILSGYIMRQSVRALEEHFEAHQIPLTHLQHGILRAVQFERFTLSDLSRKFGLDPSTLVPVVDSLVKRGFIDRERDPNDRRRAPLVVTGAGSDMLAQLPPMGSGDPVAQSLTAMGEADAARLITLLRSLIMYMPEGETMLSELDARADFHREASSNHALRCMPDARPQASEPAHEPDQDDHS